MPDNLLDSPPTAEAEGDTLAERVSGLVRELTGRAPLVARATVAPDHVVVSLAGGLADRGKLGPGFRARASDVVEELTSDKVVHCADHSNIGCDAIIIFFRLAQTRAARSRTPPLSHGVRDVAVPSNHGRRSPSGTTAAPLERAG